MYKRIKYDFTQELLKIKGSGLYKEERIILSDQKPSIRVSFPAGSAAREVLNFCANNYLGLSNHPRILEAARRALDEYGFGLASVRFICGTQDLHKKLEEKISEFFQTEDAILYSSCFDANGGLFESLLGAEDAIVTDALNHASIIDGIRLCKAKRFIYDHADMASLESALQKAREGMDIWDGPGLAKEPVPARNIMIITDGVFSMDGDIADIRRVNELGNTYDALVVVDDSHGTGVLGATGRGAVEHAGMLLAGYAYLQDAAGAERAVQAIEHDYGPWAQVRLRPDTKDETFYPRHAAHLLLGVAWEAFGPAQTR